MKKTTLAILAAAMLLVVFRFDACKKADAATATLTVIVSAGVSGTPAAGTHTVTIGETQAYSYSLEAGYEKLTVLLDGVAVAASGSLTVSGNHTIQAYSDDNRQYTLTVSLAAGVTGTPAAGSYPYTQGTKVNYSYALAEGYANLAVTVDGDEAAGKGTITMSEDITLAASAVKKYNIQGPWTMTEAYNDGSSFAVTVTFSGSYTAGTVSDSQGGSGTYDYSDATLDFTLLFPDLTYEYKETSFTDENTMSGTCKRYRPGGTSISGSWSATRVTTTAAAVSSLRSFRKKSSVTSNQ